MEKTTEPCKVFTMQHGRRVLFLSCCFVLGILIFEYGHQKCDGWKTKRQDNTFQEFLLPYDQEQETAKRLSEDVAIIKELLLGSAGKNSTLDKDHLAVLRGDELSMLKDIIEQKRKEEKSGMVGDVILSEDSLHHNGEYSYL